MITLSPIYKPLFSDKEKFIYLVTGGRGSGKSYGVGTFIESLTFEKGHVMLYCRYTMMSAETSVIPEFHEKIEGDGAEKYFHITKTDVVNILSGSKILFRGIKTSSGNQTAKLKSIQGLTTFVCDEGEEWTSEKEFDKIMLSIRQKGIKNRIIIIMNPSDVNHFVYQKYIKNTHKIVYYDGVPVQISTHPSVLHIHSTYLDNIENLSDEFLKEIDIIKEAERLPDGTYPVNGKYAQIVIGRWADISEGVIFKKIEIVDEIPSWAKTRGRGNDFGYTNDPTAIIDCAILDKDLYLDELCYKTHMLTNEIISEMKKQDSEVMSESADPRLIDEIKNAGIIIYPVDKFPGSIIAGINKMLEYNIKVTKRSVNLLYEFRNYTWDKDKDGNYINEPIDKWNHCFSGETMVLTDAGNKRIDSIKIGDHVITSNGCKRVNKTFNNGRKKILDIRLIFDTFIVEIKATPNHKFKTIKGWKQLHQLTKGDVLYGSRYLMAKNIGYIQENDIFLAEQNDYTEKYGNFTMGKFQKDITSTIKTEIHKTTKSKTLNLLKGIHILKSIVSSMCKIKELPILGNAWIMQENSPMNGMVAMKVGRGIQNMLLRLPQILNHKNLYVNGVEANLKQSQMEELCFAQINANQRTDCIQAQIMKQEFASGVVKNLSSTNTTQMNFVEENAADNILQTLELKRIEIIKEDICNVYDLEIEDTHEYFANGILVHNCIDAVRYWILGKILGRILEPKNLKGIFY